MAESKGALQQSPDRVVGTHRPRPNVFPATRRQSQSTGSRRFAGTGSTPPPRKTVRAHGGLMVATTVFHREMNTHEVKDTHPVGRGARLRTGRQLHDQPPL